MGEDIAENLDCQPNVFTVELAIRREWTCARCKTPVAAHIIDKVIPSTSLLA